MMKKVLSIETSCDDTCVSIVREDGKVLVDYKQDQIKEHAPFGGVVPENASRNHSKNLLPLVDQALKKISIEDIDLIACTSRPGLMGSLLIGVITARSLAHLYRKPLITVNHIEGHILSPFLYDEKKDKPQWSFPYVCLVVSGGHTHLFYAESLTKYTLLGQTLDDAAGEAFDKFARLMKFPYASGVYVDQNSKGGKKDKFSFPIALHRKGNLNFSFSGLKTASYHLMEKLTEEEKKDIFSLCASFQEAVVQQLVFKLDECLKKYPVKRVAVVGGVSANSRLRKVCTDWAQDHGVHLALPLLRYCTDNASMIGYTALQRYIHQLYSEDHRPYSHHLPNDFIKL